MTRFIAALSMTLLLATMVAACSSGGGVTPDGPGGTAFSSQLPIYVSPSSDGVLAGTGALGMYELTINPQTQSCDVVPLRYSSFVPNEYEVDLTTALTTSFCKDCFVVQGVSINGDGNILLDIAVKHPFAQVTALPAPRPQRPDLHVFDVQGIAVVEGSTSFPRSSITLNPQFLINADGYTTAFDAAIDALGGSFMTTANAHPFKILSKGDYTSAGDDIGNYDPNSLNGYPNPAGILNPDGFNVMKCGSGYLNTTFEIKSSGAPTSFKFLVTCSFGQSSKGLGTELQKRDNPIYLLPAFSKPEAVLVDVVVENNDLADNDNTSTADVVVKIVDWQEAYGATPANPNFDPSIDQAFARNTLIKESDINNVVIDIPDLNSPIDDAVGMGIIPTGNATYLVPKQYRIPVNNDTFASEIFDPSSPPQFWGLVSVRDDLEGVANPTGGIDRDLLVPDSMFSISDYTTYQVFGISIFPPNDPPVPVITCTDPGGPSPFLIVSGATVDFHGNSSFDESAIIKYEWDFDYDPVTKNFALPSADEYFSDPDPAVAADPPAWAMNNIYAVDDIKYVALRITDDSPGATTSVAYVEVVIGPNKAPFAELGVAFYDTNLTAPYTFYEGEKITLKPGTGCSDDGAITTYQYDFDYDGVLFTVDSANTTGNPVLSPEQHESTPTMAIRVIDNGIPNMSDIDSTLITINAPAVDVPVQVSTIGASGIDLTSAGYHAIAFGDGSIACAWTQSGTMADIYYSVSSDAGATWSVPAAMNANLTGTQEAVALTVDRASDTYYAVFKDNSSGTARIRYAISDPGASAWQASSQGLLPAVGTGSDDPSICINPATGQLYVAYLTTLGGFKQIIVQTSSDNGATWNTPAAGINSDNTNDRTDPCIVWNDTDNEVGVAWDDLRSGTYQIYFNWGDSTGTTFQASDVHVAPSANGQNDPSLAVDAGTFIMSYDELASPTDIYFTSSDDGITWSVPLDITDNADSVHNNSSICIDGLGTYYITTRDARETKTPTQPDIYIFKSTDAGLTWVRGVRANDRVGTENAYNPNIAGNPDSVEGGFIVMYESPDNTVYCAVSGSY